jgi:uracil-DNA glycosylase family protein
MYRAYVAGEHDFESWRQAARPFLLAGIAPQDITWAVGPALADATPPPEPLPGATISVPKAFFDLAQRAIAHDDPNRFALLYAFLYIVSQDRTALTDRSDPLTARVEAMAHEVTMARTRTIEATSNSETAWQQIRDEAMSCTRCDLYKHATQTIFGEGPLDAKLMLVGEQPGDQEDRQGRPFVGPAGQLLDRALEKAGIDRTRVYVSNAVKHFKFEQRGKRRIHSKPNAGEITACRWWIDQERALIKPPVIVALGATAAQSLLGKAITISRMRGTPIPLGDGSECHVTIHPSYLLRIDDDERGQKEYRHFVEDLTSAYRASKH